ncbi:flavin reductase family protein [Cryobacterium sp. SO2]|uniref:flavin reductase family protein n=1 Tax=Cryobacterium sp. SO2 TaxID=1897060 RepID=UPI00223D7436|nr:flavin reductase family protein [Cryobacterium sp. SO2]WEO76467.1 flavin reductase family protein [Cryobacterium sp. SO2]
MSPRDLTGAPVDLDLDAAAPVDPQSTVDADRDLDLDLDLVTALAPTDTHGLETISSDPSDIRSAFGKFPSGVAALCAEIDGVPTGLVASSFSVGVSYEPPLVLFSVQNSSTTWPVLRQGGRIGVSILGSDHARECYQLASRKGDRFAGLDTRTTELGALFIEGSSLWLDCEIYSETPAGDHTIVLLEVKSLKVSDDRDPLIYHSAAFRSLLPAEPKAA